MRYYPPTQIPPIVHLTMQTLTAQILGSPFHDDVNGGTLLGVGVGVLTSDLVPLVVCGGPAVHVLAHCVVHLWVDL